MKNILYFRNFPGKVNIDSYNLQEVGFGKSFVDRGINCDVVYYHEEKEIKIQEVYNCNGKSLRIIWTPALKIFNNGIYFKLLNKTLLKKYDLIITTEYAQIMTYLLSKNHNNVYLYHGPYKDPNKMYLQRFFDFFLLKSIRKNLKHSFVKSELANKYLKEKGFQDVFTLGVGLDCNKFKNYTEEKVPHFIKAFFIENKKRKILLYIGTLEERRNIMFLLNVFKEVHNSNKDTLLLIIGDGQSHDLDRYMKYAEELNIKDSIKHIKKVNQEFLPYIYKESSLFLFPTKYDIFGMVLLESMYFGLPTISSENGGAVTLIKNNKNGILLNLSETEWVNQINILLEDSNFKKDIIKNGKDTILNEFLWSNISQKLIDSINQKVRTK